MTPQYKILVTSRCYAYGQGEAISVHTVVVDFETKEQADLAFYNMQQSTAPADIGVKQVYTKLY
jgi:hypothetical protein